MANYFYCPTSAMNATTRRQTSYVVAAVGEVVVELEDYLCSTGNGD
jgi:hypothetical protein